ncbi:MAG: hypothetical protein KIH69_006215 [Anaerolineae bacterium]|nr:hypothetical protein [Anaerolineae bacterium]
MTQSEFRAWLDAILGDMPFEEFVSPEILEHMNRVHLENEARAWGYAKEESLEAFQVTVRAMCKTMFAIGFDAGREQANVDSMFGGSSSLSSSRNHDDDDLLSL